MNHQDVVEVDGLRIVGAYVATGHSGVATLESAFLRQHIVFPEHTAVLHWRWQFILERIPAMRGRHLYDDLRDIYSAVAHDTTGHSLYAAYDLTILQQRLWGVLNDNGMSLPHAAAWHICVAQGRQRRLLSQVERYKPWRRNSVGKVKKAFVPPEVPGKWFN